MLACISKNDRASLLFAELQKLNPDTLDLGLVRASRFAKVLGALSSFTTDRKQLQTDMDFSLSVAHDMQQQTEARIHRHPGISHVLQWGAMYAPVSQTSKIPYSIITDGPYDPDDPTYPVEWRPIRGSESYISRQREVYSRAEYVFPLSDWARNKVLKLNSLDPDHVIRIGWGPMFRVSEPNLSSTPSSYFVSIGNQWHRKGMDLVASAGHMVHLQHPEIETIIGGEPDGLTIPSLGGVKQLPRKINTQEVIELISGARALIVASRFDASPHIVMEALQLGTPVIGANTCGVPEAIQPPRGGLTVPGNEVQALFEAMEQVLSQRVVEQRRGAFATYLSSGGWEQSALIISRALQSAF